MPDFAIHSDFLIHWTGSDLDQRFCNTYKNTGEWSSDANEAYVNRLENILKYGFWLTEEPSCEYSIDGENVHFPVADRVCFSELKLSQCRTHASQYGGLGIGVKRPFLSKKGGRPVIYFLNSGAKIDPDPFLSECVSKFKQFGQTEFLQYFKPMSKIDAKKALNYGFYAESEWRILYSRRLVDSGILIDPRAEERLTKYAAEYEFFDSLDEEARSTLKYLLPLDCWLSMIIYPSVAIKNLARESGIPREIERIKSLAYDRNNKIEGGVLPIELDLDACRNF